MLKDGFVKLHRSITNWEWYQDSAVKAVFLHLLITVNFEDRRWMGRAIRRGQRVTSYAGLANETGLSVQQVRTALGKLKKTGEVLLEAGPKNTLITLTGFERYQATLSEGGRQQTANRGETSEPQQRKKEKRADNLQELKETQEEKKAVAPFVFLTQNEVESLRTEYGETALNSMILALNGYKGATGKVYASDYWAMVSWVAKKVETDAAKAAKQPGFGEGLSGRFDYDEIEKVMFEKYVRPAGEAGAKRHLLREATRGKNEGEGVT